MNHNDIRHKISEYLDGALTSEDKVLVEEHLKICPDCGNAVTELRKTVEHIRKIEDVEPPAWMTQKIMARVRAEEEKKKQGLFRKIFLPLHVKLPVEAIGVLFIAVTVYFVQQEVQETKQRFPEAPRQAYSAAPAEAEKGMVRENNPTKPNGLLQRKRETPRGPGYALDMNEEQEKPKSAPAPAPEPAGPAEKQQSLRSESASNLFGETAPGSMQDGAAAKEFSGRAPAAQPPLSRMTKKKAAGIGPEEKREGSARAELKGMQMLTLAVSGIDQGAARVEDAIRECGGKMLAKEPDGEALFLTVSIDHAGRSRLIEKLKALGEVSEDAAEIHGEGTVIKVKIVKQK